MKWAYFLIDFGAMIIPLVYSFHPRIRFDRQWKAAWTAIVISMIPFLIWDMIFTEMGVWGFQHEYLLGWEAGNLPFEEVMFFVAIPYACTFTYYCFSKLLTWRVQTGPNYDRAVLLFTILLAVTAGVFSDRIYTLTTFSSLAIFLALHVFWFKSAYLHRFFFTYAIIMLPFLVVNGLLTGTGLERPIVWYNDAEQIGFRLLTIPMEDIFYGMLLILLNIMIFEKLKTAEK